MVYWSPHTIVYFANGKPTIMSRIGLVIALLCSWTKKTILKDEKSSACASPWTSTSVVMTMMKMRALSPMVLSTQARPGLGPEWSRSPQECELPDFLNQLWTLLRGELRLCLYIIRQTMCCDNRNNRHISCYSWFVDASEAFNNVISN